MVLAASVHERCMELFILTRVSQTLQCAFAGLTIVGALLTYFAHTLWGPYLCSKYNFFSGYMNIVPYVSAAIYTLVGVLHFVAPVALCGIVPPRVRACAITLMLTAAATLPQLQACIVTDVS